MAVATGWSAARLSAHSPFAVGERVLTLTDASRTVRLPHRAAEPRTLVTVIRYPAVGQPSGSDHIGAASARRAGPFPLIVFGHGFDVTPGTYWRLLHYWAAAGYVVAAPVFPRTNAHAPGGPDEADIVNQPADLSFVITRLLAASAGDHGALSGLIDPKEIAVAGQSDGGETALATAYDPPYRDPRVLAAVILSGAELPAQGFKFATPSPPLLATQGTADETNLPANTYHFYDQAPAPKFLLRLLGAPHLGPYTDEQPDLGIVERVSVAFMDDYLKHLRGAWARLWAAGFERGISTLAGAWR